MRRSGKPVHVQTDLGDEHVGGRDPDAEDLIQTTREPVGLENSVWRFELGTSSEALE
jgi:hypothetical protein